MAVPYTPDAVKVIRSAADSGQSRRTVRAALGWDDGMLDRICRRHGIMLAREAPSGMDASAAAAIAAAAKDVPVGQPPAKSRTPRWATTLSLYVTAAMKARLQAQAEARATSLSASIVDMLEAALASGAAANCRPYVGERRRVYITVGLHAEVKDRLRTIAQQGAHGSPAALAASIIDRHLKVVARRSAAS